MASENVGFYEENVKSPRSFGTQVSRYSHIRFRSERPSYKNLGSQWDYDYPIGDLFGLIEVRTRELIDKGCDFYLEFMDSERDFYSIDQLAKKYLSDDYHISPRVARKAIFSALVRLAKPGDLDSIDPDPINIFRALERDKRKREKKAVAV